MFAVWKNIVWYDALTVCLRKFNHRHWTRRFFIENRAQLGFRNDLFKHGKLGAVEMLFLLLVVEMPQIQRPNANLRDFKWIEDIHGDGIRALICQVAANPAAQSLESLSDVNRLAVVIVKRINAPCAPSNFISVIVQAFEEGFYLLAN